MGKVEMPAHYNGTSAARRVKLDRVWKEYSSFVAVEDVSFTLEPGEFLTLLGPSGSGKTTTLLMVAGFERPTRGSIKVDDVDVVSCSPQHRNFGVVFQGYALFPHMTARENVEFPLRMRGLNPQERRRSALDMLDKVGLTDFADRRPRELSGGQQQRVALARALVFQPNALLLDEPLGALDKNLRERMQYEIKELQRRIGISILFVTHDQDEAMTMSDRIAVMDAGKIVQIGSPQEIYYRPMTPFVASFFGETNLVPCRAQSSSGAYTNVAIDDGPSGLARSARTKSVFDQNKATLLSVRPERIKILRNADQMDFVADGIVAECTFLGRHFRVVVQAGRQKYSILTSDLEFASSISTGTALRFGWLRDDAQVLLLE